MITCKFLYNVQRNKMSSLSGLGGGEAYGARWTLGALLLAPLAATSNGYYTVTAIIMLAIYILIAAFTCSDLKQLAVVLPPKKTCKGRRERNIRSFADFIAMWMTFLSHLVAVAICARILSATADHVTEGKTRRWLFGYETRALGEPWPDVLGVTIVVVVCAMFMCGLEESIMFTFILLALLYVFSQFFAIFGLINLDIANIKIPSTISIYEIFSAGAPISYAFSYVLPSKQSGKLKRNLFIMIGLPMIVLSGLCFLYTNMLKGTSVDAALPVMSLLEARTTSWVCPVLAALTLAGVCLALTELCPLLFTVLVALASPEWKVLTRSMTYESATTGSPVLAVFTAGSLAAILAFACPLSHMLTLMNASHLLGIAIQALHFTIMRCVPTAEQKEAGDVAYKRLGVEASSSNATKAPGPKLKGLRFLSTLRHTKTLESIKSKVAKDSEERECLLLDEYGGHTEEMVEIVVGTSNSDGLADSATVDPEDITLPSEGEQTDQDATSGDDSTDIDAVVKEYQDRIQVVTATPVANAPVPPCIRGARLSAIGALIQVVANILLATAICVEHVTSVLLVIGMLLWICGTCLSAWQPAHGVGPRGSQRFQGPCTILLTTLFLTSLLLDSWHAILLFAGAGVVIYARCERWCGNLAVRQAQGILLRRTVPATPSTSTLTHVDTLYITR